MKKLLCTSSLSAVSEKSYSEGVRPFILSVPCPVYVPSPILPEKSRTVIVSPLKSIWAVISVTGTVSGLNLTAPSDRAMLPVTSGCASVPVNSSVPFVGPSAQSIWSETNGRMERSAWSRLTSSLMRS